MIQIHQCETVCSNIQLDISTPPQNLILCYLLILPFEDSCHSQMLIVELWDWNSWLLLWESVNFPLLSFSTSTTNSKKIKTSPQSNDLVLDKLHLKLISSGSVGVRIPPQVIRSGNIEIDSQNWIGVGLGSLCAEVYDFVYGW